MDDTYTDIRPVILGEEINNPYTVEVINQAQSQLYDSAEFLSATHHYIRMKPQNQDDLVTISDWSLENRVVTLDYPMHYEIIREGDYYIDP